MTRARHVVVGVGNPYRGDDGAALVVVDRLRTLVPEDVDVAVCEQEPTRLLDTWRGSDLAIVVDAVASGAEPGVLHRHDASEEPLPARVYRSSTHALGVGETIELARAIGELPDRVIVYGIEGQAFESGNELSAAVAAAVDGAVDAILGEVGRSRKEQVCTNER